MTENRTTATLGGVAGALLLLTLVSAPRYKPPEKASDLGKPFYPEFTDSLKAASLEVVEYDETRGAPRPFKVQLTAGRYVIPSHHNYPADAKERLQKTAAPMIDLKREDVRSDRSQDHETFGVIDPLDKEAAGAKGRGKRVVLRDLDGKVLSDLVFGRETKEGSGKRFVRLPDQKRVYTTSVKAEISSKFSDWIETDLLQLNQSAVRKVLIDKYSVDEVQRVIKDRSTFSVSREESSKPWQVTGMKETEEPHADNISQILNALDDLKIVGVRPKPAFLVEGIKILGGDLRLKVPRTQQEQMQVQAVRQLLSPVGYFLLQQGEDYHIVSNEGDINAFCDDGVAYTLRFGEVILGEGEEVEAGKEEKKEEKKEGEKKDEKQEEKKEEKKSGKENRFLMVTVRFDETLLPALAPEPAAPAPPKPEEKKDEKKPDEKKPEEKKPEEKQAEEKKPDEKKAEEKKPQDSPEAEKHKKDKEEWDRKKKDHDQKVADGKKRAKQLTDRFADWYYVISADLFQKLRRDQKDLVKPKEKKEEEKKPEEPKKPEDKKPEEPKKPDEKKPDAPKPEEKKPEDKKPEEKKPEPPKPDEKKPEEKKPEEKKP